MPKTTDTATAEGLLEQQIYDLRVNAAYLRMRARDEPDARDAAVLRTTAEQISKLTSRLERTLRRTTVQS